MPSVRRSVLLAPVAALLAAAPAHASLLGGLTQTVTTTVTNTTSSTPLAPVVQQVTQPVAPVVNTVEQVVQPVTQPVTQVTQPVVDQVGATVGEVVGTLNTATGGTGAAGGLLNTGGGQFAQELDRAAASGTLPQVTVVRLLGLLGPSAGAAGATSDGRAPKVVVTALSRLGSTGRTGKVKLRVTSSEPSVVVLGGTIRPGKARKGSVNSRKPIHFRAVTLAFRKAGALQVTVVLSRKAQRHLGAARDGRLSVQALAVDLARNQSRVAVKRSLRR